MARLKDKYRSEVIPALKERFGYKNVMEIPKLEKVVINSGPGRLQGQFQGAGAGCDRACDQLRPQKPLVTKAKKSIANFKVRAGMNVGAKVTLRGDRMY